MSCSASAWVQPCSSTLKFGSSKSRSCGSDRTNATDCERWVTRLRACWLTTYPVLRMARSTASWAALLTLWPPLSTRETVPRDTPATAATSLIGRAGAARARSRAAAWFGHGSHSLSAVSTLGAAHRLTAPENRSTRQ